MEVLHDRVAGLDVHKATVMACVRHRGVVALAGARPASSTRSWVIWNACGTGWPAKGCRT
jgi:hypothetical protein